MGIALRHVKKAGRINLDFKYSQGPWTLIRRALDPQELATCVALRAREHFRWKKTKLHDNDPHTDILGAGELGESFLHMRAICRLDVIFGIPEDAARAGLTRAMKRQFVRRLLGKYSRQPASLGMWLP